MSELLKQIKADQVAARKAKDKNKAVILTTLLGEASPGGNNVVTDEKVQAVIKKFLKNLHDVIGYTANPEIQDRMKYEISVLTEYLPAQLSDEQLRTAVREALASLNDVEGNRKVGMVMKQLKEKYDGQYDGKTASSIVKEMV